jgi:hypothetical protein
MLCQLSYASRRATAGGYETAARERYRFQLYHALVRT